MCIQGGCTGNPVIISFLCFICSVLLTFCLFISLVTEWRKMVGTYSNNYQHLPWFCPFNKCTCVRGCSVPCSLGPFIFMENCSFSAHVPCPGVSSPDIYVETPDSTHSFLFVHIFVCILSVSRMHMIDLCFLKESHFTISAF